MDKSYLIQLTNNLYRLTLLFPKKEPLRYKMREIADDILANLLPTSIKVTQGRPGQNLPEKSLEEVIGDLEVLDGFFEVAKNQNWVSPVELLPIQEEYNRIRAEIEELAKKLPDEKQTLPKPAEVRPPQELAFFPRSRPLEMNSRQEKIMEFLKENERAQVKDLKQIFPEVSKRTLRRDFRFLLKQGKIERVGEKNETFYQIKR